MRNRREEMSITNPEARRLHNWAMWRMTVNQELIQGLEVSDTGSTGGQSYHSYRDNYSLTQRYIQNPQVQRNESFHIRSNYGIPPSPKNPMGDGLFFLYGLPRVSTSPKVPDVLTSSEDLSVPQIEMHSYAEDQKRSPRPQRRIPEPNGMVHAESYQARDERRQRVSSPEVRMTKSRHMSPVNFRDRPEVEYKPVHPGKVNNINKPVLVPPEDFREEVLRRSNIDLPLNIDDHEDDMAARRQSGGYEDGFEDPRFTMFNDRHAYAWGDGYSEGFGVMPKPYVDESHMKTHI